MGENLKFERPEFAQFGEHFGRTLGPCLSDLEDEQKTRFTIGIMIAIVLLPIALLLSWYLVIEAPNVRRGDRLYLLSILLPFILPATGYFLANFSMKTTIRKDPMRVKSCRIDSMREV